MRNKFNQFRFIIFQFNFTVIEGIDCSFYKQQQKNLYKLKTPVSGTNIERHKIGAVPTANGQNQLHRKKLKSL